eukprot:2150359-Pyramimonas_sp.AAC.1
MAIALLQRQKFNRTYHFGVSLCTVTRCIVSFRAVIAVCHLRHHPPHPFCHVSSAVSVASSSCIVLR